MYTHEQILEAFDSAHPLIDPRWTYCLFTGAPLASIESYDFAVILDMLTGTIEERVEQLLMRCLNASRPSPIWTMVNESHLGLLRERSACQLLAYLRNGATGLRKNQHNFYSFMQERIESFVEICGLDDDELESAFIQYHLDAARKADEESRVARRMRAWLVTQTPEGKEAERRLRIEALETEAERLRLNRWVDESRKQAVSKKAKKARAEKSFFDSIFNEIMNADAGLLKPVDHVLTQPSTPLALNKPAFRIALTKKDS
jgi:hypothetical protein